MEDWSEKEEEEFDEEGNLVPEEFKPNGKYTKAELEEWGDKLLREDSNRELCRTCRDLNLSNPKKQPNPLPYGEETGNIESVPQYDKETDEPMVDEEGNQLYVDFPELICNKKHRWYKGEGPRRNIQGPNPILFESHLYDRRRREIMVASGVPDPAYTTDRFGRPTQGVYNRTRPNGRKTNTKEQRAKSGASFYR